LDGEDAWIKGGTNYCIARCKIFVECDIATCYKFEYK